MMAAKSPQAEEALVDSQVWVKDLCNPGDSLSSRHLKLPCGSLQTSMCVYLSLNSRLPLLKDLPVMKITY
jgi:hypothetical protein